MSKRATANEVAKLAGVSKWTVMRAFTTGASITQASREKVLEAARQLHYSPNLLARSLATRTTHQVAVFVDDFGNPHKLPLLEKLTSTLQSEGLVAVLININNTYDHVKGMMTAEQRQLDAVVLFGTAFHDDALMSPASLARMPPTFVISRDSRIEGVTAITCDTTAAMAEICAHLSRRDYRRPAFMTGPPAMSTALGRRDAFVAYWQERGIETVELFSPKYSTSAAAETLRAFLSQQPARSPIDLIMCENDIMACGAKDVLVGEYGFKVPEDVAIVGFDNIDMAASPAYDLTTYEQPEEEIARATVDMILGRRRPEALYLKGTFRPRSSA